MPLPVGLNTITVTGTFADGAGNPLTGTVTFIPNADLIDSAGAVILRAEPVTARVTAGVMTPLLLPCTDNTAISPSGWAWTVTEYIGGASENLPARTYTVLLPHTDGPTVDLSALVPVTPGPPVSTQYGVLATGYTNTWSSTQVFDGPVDIIDGLTLGATPIGTPPGGTTEYLRGDGTWAVPAGSGGGAVSSVNTKTGAVTLAATDVGAIPASAEGAASGVATLDSSGHLTAAQAALLLAAGNDLSELAGSASAARGNLGLGTAATQNTAAFDAAGTAAAAQAAAQSFATSAVGTETTRAETAEATKLTTANNLSELTATAAAARTSLGLGSAATQAASAFDAAGAAASAQAAAQTFATGAVNTETTRAEAAEAAALQKASNLSDLGNAATARTNLGLGSAATQASTAFDTAGAASAAQTAAQAFATSAVGTETTRATAAEATKLTTANNLSDVPLPATARTNLGVPYETNAANFQPLGVAAVGGNGAVSDSGHVHPVAPWQFSVARYGAKGDGQAAVDGAITAATNTLTCATSTPFKPGDVGKAIMVKGAGAAGITTLVTTISGYTDSGHVTLTANAAVTVASGGLVLWATDDTSAFQQAVNAAMAYGQAHGQYGEVVVPSPTGLFYGIAGPLVNTVNASTLWNSQITLPVVSDRNPKVTLAIKGAGNSGTTRHWNQNYPAFNPSSLVSFGVFASQSAQATSVTNSGNPSVIGGPTGKYGYGGAGQLFNNVLISLQDITILTTHSSSGWTYGATNLWGCATAGLTNFSCSTTGMVELYGGTNDYGSGSTFGGGASIGILLPGSGNNADTQLVHVTVGGGYTYGIYATEHTTAKGLTILYCWSGLCPVGIYNDGGSGIGGQHAIFVDQCCIEACLYHLNFVGVGTVGPTLHAVLDTEGTVNFRDTTSGTSLAAANGEVRMTGTSSSPTLTNPTGLRIIREQIPSGVAATGIPALVANTAVCNTLYRAATVYLAGGTSLTTIQVSTLAGGASAPAVSTVADFTAAGTIVVPFPVRVGPGQWIKINTSAGTTIPTAVWVLD